MYTFYNDPGHGWLKVKLSELIELGIENEISLYSYQNGDSVYLEEDCDASTFLKAYEKQNGTPAKYEEVYQERTPIRGYAAYVAPKNKPAPIVKRFFTRENIGRARYVVNFHDGIKTHPDGSEFYDIDIFSNKKKRDKFIKALVIAGYIETNGI